MRLWEIEGIGPAERRVTRFKSIAKAAKDRAKQLKAQADIGWERLEMQKSKAALAQALRSAVTSTIKPYR